MKADETRVASIPLDGGRELQGSEDGHLLKEGSRSVAWSEERLDLWATLNLPDASEAWG
jgi:hypothetical protein